MTDAAHRLAEPAARYMAPVEIIGPETSLGTAADLLNDTGRMLAVAEDARYIGMVGEAEVLSAIHNGADPSSPVQFSRHPSLRLNSSGAEAVRILTATGSMALAVVDGSDRPVGILTASALLSQSRSEPRPRMVGGMATPFGVYLTNGAVSGGVGSWALVATGMLLFTMFLVATVLSIAVGFWLEPLRWPEWVKSTLIAGTSAIGFLGILRALPLTGYHAAEHMTVHAIERGEPLLPEIVKRMPRVHPRCGTNIAVGATLFMSLATTTWIANQELKLLAAAAVSLFLWRPIGSFMQFYITTRKPNDRQISAGIAAGQELLNRFAAGGAQPRGFAQKLLLSGIFHIMIGSFIVFAILQALLWILPVPEAWKVYF